MTADVELLPLYAELQGHPKLEIIKHYARSNVAHATAAKDAEIEALRAEVERLRDIAGWGGLAGDAPERIILASEMFDGLRTCDKWLDVRRVIDDGKPLPESATAYVRADRAERLAEALREAADMLLADYPETAKRLRATLNPTAAQEGKESFWPKLPGSGGPDWTGHD